MQPLGSRLNLGIQLMILDYYGTLQQEPLWEQALKLYSPHLLSVSPLPMRCDWALSGHRSSRSSAVQIRCTSAHPFALGFYSQPRSKGP